MKVLYVSSSGGHWEELMCLRELFGEHDSVFVTEKGGQSAESRLSPLYTVPKIDRHEKNFLMHFIKLFRKAGRIIKKEDPDVVVTTGALAAYPFCLKMKMKRKKIVYIESFARVTERSLTGRLCYPLADLFLVQWKELLKLYPKAKYIGGIF